MMKRNKKVVESMHKVIMTLNNEEAYGHWIILGVPDCPSQEDFEYFAEDEQEFEELVTLFHNLLKEFGEDGVYSSASTFEERKEVLQAIHRTCNSPSWKKFCATLKEAEEMAKLEVSFNKALEKFEDILLQGDI